MPELPEVETIRRGLAQYLPGKTITVVEVLTSKQFIGDPQSIVGQKIQDIGRKGKLLLMELNDKRTLATHLKMTGQLIWKAPAGEMVMGGHPEQAYIESLPGRHTRIIITFNDNSSLYFNDLRKFGWIHVLTPEELAELDFLKRLGPEPLTEAFTVSYLEERLRKSPRTPIKSFLLDQTHIAGLGNIYADESLFRAAIHPQRLAGSLNHDEAVILTEKIKETLQLALHHGGSSERDYLTAIGEKGTYLKVAQVYHKTGLLCPRCKKAKIERIKLGGRSTHFCPNCQK
jgi:formamidopyrimidine-DNA glycosylase